MADVIDVLTLAEGKAALRKHVASLDEATLASWITAASEMLDDLIGPVVCRTVVEHLTGRGETTLFLRYHPNTSVTSVVEYSGSTPYELVAETNGNPSDGYVAEPYEYDPRFLGCELHRRVGGLDASWARGRNNVEVTYVAGRFADTASVRPKHKRAVGLILLNAWRSMEDTTATQGEFDIPFASFPTFAMPKAVRQMFPDEIQDPLPM